MRRSKKMIAVLWSGLFLLPLQAFSNNPCGTSEDLSSSVYYTPHELSSQNVRGFEAAVRLEGVGVDSGGNYVNERGAVDPSVSCEIPAGLGVGSKKNQSARGKVGCLVPFFSVAAELSATTYHRGDLIFVPAVKAANIQLPNGKIHPGYFIVQDTGHAFENAGLGRFDFYTGNFSATDPQNPFAKIMDWLSEKKSCLREQTRKKFELIRFGHPDYEPAIEEVEEAVGGRPPVDPVPNLKP